MMSGGGGGVSSKRNVLIWFVLLFTALVICSCFGINASGFWQQKVVDITETALVLVFGEKALDFLLLLRGQKTTSTTVVAPPDSTVVTTTTDKK